MGFVRRDLLRLAGAGLAGLAGAGPGWTEDAYPSRPVRVIVPFEPGGIDVIARLIAQKLSDRMGQQFYVENIGGAGGSIGTVRAARATPDGYTILFTASALVITPILRDNALYDPQKDFVPVTSPATASLVLLVNQSLPVKTVEELVALIRATPAKYSFASAGAGTPPHLVGEMFRQSLGLDIVHVPYNSGALAVGSVVGGHTTICFAAAASAVAQVADGKLRALAVAGRARLQALPEVPTMAQAGHPAIEGEVWSAFLLPAGAPAGIVARLHREIVGIIALPDIRDRLAALGYTPVGNTPEQLAADIGVELAKWTRVIRGLKAG